MGWSSDPAVIAAESRAYANEMKTAVTSALEKLQAVIIYPPGGFDFTPPVTFEPTKPKPLTVGELPDLEKTVFNEGFTVKDITEFNGHQFASPMLGVLEAQLADIILTGGTFIDPAVQDAMFNQTRDRDLQVLHDAMDTIADEDAAFGFPIHADTFFARQDVVRTQYMNTKSDRNREITAQIADLTQKAIMAAAEAQIKIEDLHATFTLGLGNLYTKLKDLVLNNTKLELEARLGEYEAKLKVINAGYSVQEANARVELGYQGLLEEKWKAEVQNLTERGKADIAQLMEQAKLRLSAIALYTNTSKTALAAALLQVNAISSQTGKVS